MKLLLAFVCTFSLLKVVQNQPGGGCSSVNAGLDPILAPCRESVSRCVTAQNLTGISGLFCQPKARSDFNEFERCTNRTYSDQVFGAICGGPDCSESQGPFVDCQGRRCFEVVGTNEGTAAFGSCNCSTGELSSLLQDCPSQCRSDLQQLVDDLGCCSNSVIYVYYFSTCGNRGNPSLDTLPRLMEVCNVTFPQPCLHTFSDNGACNTWNNLLTLVFVLMNTFLQLILYN